MSVALKHVYWVGIRRSVREVANGSYSGISVRKLPGRKRP
jgi:hypothetical protein